MTLPLFETYPIDEHIKSMTKPSSVKVGDRITIGSGAFKGQEVTVINIHSYYYCSFDKKRDDGLSGNMGGGISIYYQKPTGIVWFVRFDDKTTTTIIDDEIAKRYI